MSKEEQILNLIKANNGVITSKEDSKHGINRIFLTRLVKSGKIGRVKNGLYVLPNTWGDEYFNLWNKCYFFIWYSTIYHITVCRGYNGKLNHVGNVELHFVKREIFELGKIEIKSPQGQMITCYNAERCICDLLKNKDKEDLETIKYAITEYLRDKQNRDLPKLVEYSKRLNVLDEVNRYLEVLM